MNNEQESLFTRTMMTGLFIGIVDTVICLIYNVGFREVISGYLPSNLINVSSLIFAINILLLLIGIVYFLFVKMFKKMDLIFTLVILAIMWLSIWQIELGHRFADLAENREFKELFIGIVLILGLSAALLPYFFKSNFFDKYIL